MPSRRQIFRTAAGVVTAFPILNAQQHEHAGAGPSKSAAYKPKWATPDEMKLIAELGDIIIPRTDTPGASDAKVQEYIDYALASDARRKEAFREGLKWFAALKPSERVAALTKASANPNSVEGRFFKAAKDLTIDGYYQSREGLATELGFSGNTFLQEFKGCTHPEHKG